MNYIILLILASLIALLPVVLIKYYINSNNNIYLYLSLLSYILLIYLYINIFKHREISSNYIILQILQIVIVFIISLILLKEPITYKKIFGLFFAILTIYLLY